MLDDLGYPGLIRQLTCGEGSAMLDKPGHHGKSSQKGLTRDSPEASADVPVNQAEGIVVVRFGNPEVLDLVHNDPSIVVEEGAVVFKEGDAADCMYIVKTGTLRIRSGSVVYEDAIAGGIVGEMALVEGSLPRSAMVYAITPCELVKIDEPRFFSLVAETPSFARTVMRVLSRRLRHMDKLYRPDRWTERS
jgi:CRP/FNR family transcriptional regulator, cyclic AMP receptor protein